MSELKPCPFCGGEAVRMDFLDNPPFKEMKGTRYFGCRNCCVVSFSHMTEAEAIEAWNTRHERTCEGCKHSINPEDYPGKPCWKCARLTDDYYEPKEDTDAD